MVILYDERFSNLLLGTPGPGDAPIWTAETARICNVLIPDSPATQFVARLFHAGDWMETLGYDTVQTSKLFLQREEYGQDGVIGTFYIDSWLDGSTVAIRYHQFYSPYLIAYSSSAFKLDELLEERVALDQANFAKLGVFHPRNPQ